MRMVVPGALASRIKFHIVPASSKLYLPVIDSAAAAIRALKLQGVFISQMELQLKVMHNYSRAM